MNVDHGNPMVSDEVAVDEQLSFTIGGKESPYIDLILPPGESFIAEPGAMLDIEDGVEMSTVLGDGSQERGFFERLWDALKRPFSGESLFSVMYRNEADSPRRVSFAAPYPGTITAIDLSEVGGEIICQRGAFLCGVRGGKTALRCKNACGSVFSAAKVS